ncbi:hypothetical protein EDC36_104215 [Tepidimonas ignava]|jgi:hypothetical protein|uniref:Uncharacterized protein n=1 Tax=Tepidimonas ignava TaxID=114249 RepID=A0A4R3LF37_9BURK|nr:hypothetical protein EDC36_104215 [Tepidimonas ignava]TSE20284.1 hypothetical protein Tigna_01915 [Tepidimonas ignava]
MRKFLRDFLWYLRHGYSIRRAWHLARITL